jgi:hypothetical protein
MTPGERAIGTHWKGDWVLPRADMDVAARTEVAILAGDRILDVQSVASYCTEWTGSYKLFKCSDKWAVQKPMSVIKPVTEKLRILLMQPYEINTKGS